MRNKIICGLVLLTLLIVIFSLALMAVETFLGMPIKLEMIVKFLLLGSMINFVERLKSKDLHLVNIICVSFMVYYIDFTTVNKNLAIVIVFILYYAAGDTKSYIASGLMFFAAKFVRSRSVQLISLFHVLPINPILKFIIIIFGYVGALSFLGYYFVHEINLVSPSASNLGRATLAYNSILSVIDKPFGLMTLNQYQTTVETNVLKVFNDGKYTDPHSFVLTSLLWLGPLFTSIILFNFVRKLKKFGVGTKKQSLMIVVIGVVISTQTLSFSNVILVIWSYTGYLREHRRHRSHHNKLPN